MRYWLARGLMLISEYITVIAICVDEQGAAEELNAFLAVADSDHQEVPDSA